MENPLKKHYLYKLRQPHRHDCNSGIAADTP